jgi:two-component system response regulator AtoC
MKKPVNGLTPSAERLLLGGRWDGNVRELKNAIERACMITEGTVISERELAGAFGSDAQTAVLRSRAGEAPSARPSADAPAELEQVEREHIVDVLRQVGGNRMAAAKVLGISRRALYRRLERHGITGR